MAREHSGTNFDQIRAVATKQEPLTTEDIEQLTHFAHADRKQLQNTVYWGNVIIEPSTYNNQYYRRLVEGKWIETTKYFIKKKDCDK